MKSKGFLILFTILTVLGGYRCEKKMTISDDLLGVWETSAPKYKGCYFELTKDEIVFRDIEGDVNFYKIKKVEIEKDPNEERILYTISYVDLEGLEYPFLIYYYPGDEGVIRFQNQPNIVWVKSDAD